MTPSPPSDWMQIEIRPGRGWLPGSVVFTIIFTNKTTQERELAFSNQSGKAEYLGFAIHDVQGGQLEPLNRTIGRYNSPAKAHLIPGQGSWKYKLKGILRNGELRFSKIRYKVKKGATWKVSFNYAGVTSPLVEWTT